ncbi:MAG: ABC transporter substrate-binding protein [Deltaproteobacteria bacterium]|nr:ABC transporter substrate-binding protein [Deltaproteobacteria bacterium]
MVRSRSSVQVLVGVLSLTLSAALATTSAGCDKLRGKKKKPAPSASPSASASPSPTPGGEGGTILIGEFGSMTGAEASFGESTHKGIELALEHINAKGGVLGKQLKLKSYDDAGNPEQATAVVTKLVTDDKVTAILGEVASNLSIAGGQVAQDSGTPMISPSSTNVQVTKDRDHVFRVCFIDPFQGFAMAKFTTETLKHTKAAILRDQTQSYSQGLADAFKDAYVKMGGSIVADESYSKGDKNFNSQLSKIKAAKPEVIFLPGYYSDVATIAKQARQLGLKLPLLGGDGWDSPELFQIGGQALDNTYFSNHYSHEEPRDAVKVFVGDFQKKFGIIPDGLAALGYDAAMLLADAMRRAGSTDKKAIRDAIASTKDFPGVTGTITIDAERNSQKPAVILKIEGGKASYVASVAPTP